MLSSLRRSLPQLGRRWKPLNFSNPNFVRIPEYHKIEEETLPDYIASCYYPTRIEEVIKERYQVVGKLGFGSTSTAWLARNNASSIDIKADNIMPGIDDDSVFSGLEEEELQHPVLRKDGDTNGRTIYMSRDLRMPKNLGDPVLYDFGSAMLGNQHYSEFIQPNIYRAPEVILGIPWIYSVDIWNVGCMIWDIYEGGSLFTGQDPEFERYRSRAHLADIIDLLGPPPPSLVARGELRDKFFSSEGDLITQNLIISQVPLEERETTLEGEEEREAFLCFMRKMLQWEPSKRSSAKELAEDE